MTKKIDCFLFYNELEMLYYRLEQLYPFMDAFILVESTLTHIGNPKPLFFLENRDKFQPFLDKIIYVQVTNLLPNLTNHIKNKGYQPESDQWKNERYQRNCIALGIEQFQTQFGQSLQDQDLFFISDLDEIVDANQLPNIQEMVVLVGGIIELPMDCYYYNLQTKHREEWNFAKVFSYEYYRHIPVIQEDSRLPPRPDLSNKIRLKLHTFHFNKKAGWHLSYFGSPQFIQNKIQQFGHQEYNSEKYTDVNTIETRIQQGTDLYGRNIYLEHIPLEKNPYLPPFPTSTFSGEGSFPFPK